MVSGEEEWYPMYNVVIPIGSRAAMIREGVTEVSSRTKENIPSSIAQRSVPCSLYYLSACHSHPSKATHQVHDDLTIRVGLESSWVLETLSESDMVVDLSVDGEDNTSIIVNEGLSTSVYESAKCLARTRSTRGSHDHSTVMVRRALQVLQVLARSEMRGERLTNTNNSQTLMDHDGVFAHVTSRPIRTPMSLFLRESNCSWSESGQVA